MIDATVYVWDARGAHVVHLRIPAESQSRLAARDRWMWANYVEGIRRIVLM